MPPRIGPDRAFVASLRLPLPLLGPVRPLKTGLWASMCNVSHDKACPGPGMAWTVAEYSRIPALRCRPFHLAVGWQGQIVDRHDEIGLPTKAGLFHIILHISGEGGGVVRQQQLMIFSAHLDRPPDQVGRLHAL